MRHAAPPKIAFLTLPTLDHFLPDIVAGLKGDDFEPRQFMIRDERTLTDALSWGDVIWFEFLWPPFIDIVNKLSGFDKRVVLRLHRIEGVETDFPLKLNWENVDDLILVSEDMRRILVERLPDLERRTRVTVVGNGIAFDRFAPSDRQDPHKIAWCGNVILRKNPMMALQILKPLVDRDPAYSLHFAGQRGDRLARMYMDHAVDTLNLRSNVHFHDKVDNVPAWLADKGIILSTSVHESFGYAIGEGMAVGAWPVIHDYPGADEFWPEETLFASVDQAVDLIGRAEPGRYRDFVTERYGLERQISALKTLLSADRIETAAIPAIAAASDAGGFRSADYWEKRYAQGGNSGAGSYGDLSNYKAKILNGFVSDNGVMTVAELGCGDGNQLSLFEFPRYVGFDVSRTVIGRCESQFGGREDLSFHWIGEDKEPLRDSEGQADLALSLDVIFHLIENGVFEQYMRDLFALSNRYVAVYASNYDGPDVAGAVHVRHRKFTDFVHRQFPEWRLRDVISNPLKEPMKCPSDFFFFEKRAA